MVTLGALIGEDEGGLTSRPFVVPPASAPARERTTSGGSHSSSSSRSSAGSVTPSSSATLKKGHKGTVAAVGTTTSRRPAVGAHPTPPVTPVRPTKLIFVEPYVDLASLMKKPAPKSRSNTMLTPPKSDGRSPAGQATETGQRARIRAPRKSRAKPKTPITIDLDTPPATPSMDKIIPYCTESSMPPPPVPNRQMMTPEETPTAMHSKGQKLNSQSKKPASPSAMAGTTVAGTGRDEEIFPSITVNRNGFVASSARALAAVLSNDSEAAVHPSQPSIQENKVEPNSTKLPTAVRPDNKPTVDTAPGKTTPGKIISGVETSKWTPVPMSHFNCRLNCTLPMFQPEGGEEKLTAWKPQIQVESTGPLRKGVLIQQTQFNLNYQSLSIPLSQPYRKHVDHMLAVMDPGANEHMFLPPSYQHNTWELEEVERILTNNSKDVYWNMDTRNKENIVVEPYHKTVLPSKENEDYMTQVDIESITWDDMETLFDVQDNKYGVEAPKSSSEQMNGQITPNKDQKVDSNSTTPQIIRSQESVQQPQAPQKAPAMTTAAPEKRRLQEISAEPMTRSNAPLTKKQVTALYNLYGDEGKIFWLGKQAYHCDPHWNQKKPQDVPTLNNEDPQSRRKKTRFERTVDVHPQQGTSNDVVCSETQRSDGEYDPQSQQFQTIPGISEYAASSSLYTGGENHQTHSQNTMPRVDEFMYQDFFTYDEGFQITRCDEPMGEAIPQVPESVWDLPAECFAEALSNMDLSFMANQSFDMPAEHILGLSRQEVLGQSLPGPTKTEAVRKPSPMISPKKAQRTFQVYEDPIPPSIESKASSSNNIASKSNILQQQSQAYHLSQEARDDALMELPSETILGSVFNAGSYNRPRRERKVRAAAAAAASVTTVNVRVPVSAAVPAVNELVWMDDLVVWSPHMEGMGEARANAQVNM